LEDTDFAPRVPRPWLGVWRAWVAV
jgi:hypothetical protein